VTMVCNKIRGTVVASQGHLHTPTPMRTNARLPFLSFCFRFADVPRHAPPVGGRPNQVQGFARLDPGLARPLMMAGLCFFRGSRSPLPPPPPLLFSLPPFSSGRVHLCGDSLAEPCFVSFRVTWVGIDERCREPRIPSTMRLLLSIMC